jgi:DNA-binding IscR family transcriptional regulator
MEGLCSIHAVMIKAEEAMRTQLAAHTLADVSVAMVRKAPAGFKIEVKEWLDGRMTARRPGRPPRTRTA